MRRASCVVRRASCVVRPRLLTSDTLFYTVSNAISQQQFLPRWISGVYAELPAISEFSNYLNEKRLPVHSDVYFGEGVTLTL